MRPKTITLFLFLFIGKIGFAQIGDEFLPFFEEAYQKHPNIPNGMLEAVAYSNTRLQHLKSESSSCQGLPQYFSVMGLVEDGKGYFQNTLQKVSSLSGVSVTEIKESPRSAILAYAAAYEKLQANKAVAKLLTAQGPVLSELSEIPDDGSLHNQFARSQQYFSILKEVENPHTTSRISTRQIIDYEGVFGAENLRLLTATGVAMDEEGIRDREGNFLSASEEDAPTCSSQRKTPDYLPALWVSANSRNFGSRDGQKVSHVTIHTVQGSYASAISWFRNPASRVSAHYVIRAFDGQVTQMVCERDRANHVRRDNDITIGIEHEGFIDEGNVWYTEAMYRSSATLVKDICDRYGLNPLAMYGAAPTDGIRTMSNACYLVKGHQHFRENDHIDPGPFWDWDKYYRLINGTPEPEKLIGRSGNFYDSGKRNKNYGNLEWKSYLIAPENVSAVKLEFRSFDLEGTNEKPFDYIQIFDGDGPNGRFLGRFSGNKRPPALTANSGKAYIEFRSDCRDTRKGWHIRYSSERKEGPCPVPKELVESNVLPTSAVLGWAAVEGADRYVVAYKHKLKETRWSEQVSNVNRVAITGLAQAGEYEWNVRTICGEDTSGAVGKSFQTPAISRVGRPRIYTVKLNKGNFYDSGGDISPYLSKEAYIYRIIPANGKNLTVSFISFDTERAHDSLTVYDGKNTSARKIGTFSGKELPSNITSTNKALTFQFVSDGRTEGIGWRANYSTGEEISVPIDPITNPDPTPDPVDEEPITSVGRGLSSELRFSTSAPTTELNLAPSYAGSFEAVFQDKDKSGRGLANRFYTVLERSGQGFQGNPGQGFFFDDFARTQIGGTWKNASGNWRIQNGALLQSDAAQPNANLYVTLAQSADEVYVYHWLGRFEKNIKNQRMGLHFFCSEPGRENRGNSYFVWIRDNGSQDMVEIYKTINNRFDQKARRATQLVAGNVYDFKVIYNPRKGRIEVYVNNKFTTSWVDSNPLRSGKAISLRTANGIIAYDDLRVLKKRGEKETITIGTGEENDIRTNAFQVHSLVVDRTIKWSDVNIAGANVSGSTQPPNVIVPKDPIEEEVPKPIGKSFLQNEYARDFALNINLPNSYFIVAQHDRNQWRTNRNTGTFLDEFVGSRPAQSWFIKTGDWTVQDRVLAQKNADLANSNISIPLRQSEDQSVLYHWRARLRTKGDNKRFGLHIYASDGQAVHRGKSYLIWFRNNTGQQGKVEIYRTNGTDLIQKKVAFVPLDVDKWYDCKVVYNPINGKFVIYLDNKNVLTWQDTNTPIKSGAYISLRTGNSQTEFADLRVYKKAPEGPFQVGVGTSPTDMAQFKSQGNKPALRLYVIQQADSGEWQPVLIEEAIIR